MAPAKSKENRVVAAIPPLFFAALGVALATSGAAYRAALDDLEAPVAVNRIMVAIAASEDLAPPEGPPQESVGR